MSADEARLQAWDRWARRMTQLSRQHDKAIARLDVELAEMRDALVNMSDHLDRLAREQAKPMPAEFRR